MLIDLALQSGIAERHCDLRGRPLAMEMLRNVAGQIGELKGQGVEAKLVSITVGDVSAVDVYVRNQRRKALEAGIGFEERNLSGSITQADIERLIRQLNLDARVTGIIIQRPIPSHISIKALQGAVDPMKDVEGMHPASIGNIVYNQLDLGPCTASASIALLKSTGLRLEGLEAVVVGHSEIVGKPIAFLLMSEGATVTVCHHMTRSVAAHARRADALFVAVGRPKLIKGNMVKPGAAVIDIGINAVKAPDGRDILVGDVDYDEVKDVAAWITPVPGGVGPVTVSFLLRNTVIALQRQLALRQTSDERTRS